MRKLGRMAYSDGAQTQTITTFGGLNRTEGCAEGEWAEMENLACFHYPSAGTQKGRVLVEEYAAPDDLFEWNGHRVVVDNNVLYYDGEALCNVDPGLKQFAVVNTKLIIWPDQIMIDLTAGSYASMSGRTETVAGSAIVAGGSIKADVTPTLRANVAMAGSYGGLPQSWCPTVLTYGQDASQLDWSEQSGWTLPEAVEKGICWPGNSQNSGGSYAMCHDGDIFIPRISGEIASTLCTFYFADGGRVAPGGQSTAPDATQQNNVGIYGVWRRLDGTISIYEGETHVKIYADIYRVGAANPLFSATFTEGDRVTITGTLGGLNDAEKVQLTAIDDGTNTLTFADGTFQAIDWYVAITAEKTLGPQAFVRDVNATSYYYCITLGGTMTLLPGDVVAHRTSGGESGSACILRSGEKLLDWTACSYGTSTVSGLGLGYYTAYAGEPGSLTIQRDIPALDFICARNNRLYGVSNSVESKVYNTGTGSYDTFTSRCIYVSALGLPARFWDFDGTDADSYQVAVASNNDFTAIFSYGGYVLCWKEDMLYKLYGDYPSAFGLYEYDMEGVQAGSHRSMQIINEVLYYKGRDGVYAYTGSTPQLVSYALGYRRYTDAVAGSDGIHYHISMADSDGGYDLYTYDTVHGLWMRGSGAEVKAFALIGGVLYAIIGTGLWALDRDSLEVDGETMTAAPVEWYAVTAPMRDAAAARKKFKWARLRLEIADGASCKLESRFDGGQWQTEWESGENGEIMADIPLTPNRCDQMELRLSGSGQVILRALTTESTKGSERG